MMLIKLGCFLLSLYTFFHLLFVLCLYRPPYISATIYIGHHRRSRQNTQVITLSRLSHTRVLPSSSLILPSCCVNSLFVGSGNAFFRGRKSPEQVNFLDQLRLLGKCPPTPSLSQHLHFSLRAKCWLRGGVGGHFLRNPN